MIRLLKRKLIDFVKRLNKNKLRKQLETFYYGCSNINYNNKKDKIMLKKIFITTCALFACIQLSFAGGIVTFVKNETVETIEFKWNVFTSKSAHLIIAKLQENGRIHLGLEPDRKNRYAGDKINDTIVPHYVEINNETYYINWIGENIETLITKNNKKYYYVGSSNSRGQKGYSVAFNNIQKNGFCGFAGTVDMVFTPN